MKSIVFIVPYFGKFPSYFQLWLNSCKLNPTIDWLIITDISEHYDYPQNVKIISMTFEELKIYIQTKYDFPINLNAPYKLCDFKPAYGEIFQEFISPYDYWGHCDVDLIWGNIRKFLTDDLLNAGYDKLFNWGHCTLHQNTAENNRTYRSKVDGIVYYRQVFSSPLNFIFDEIHGMTPLYAKLGKKVYNQVYCYDVKTKYYRFHPTIYMHQFYDYLSDKKGIFKKDEAGIYFVYVDKNEIKTKEFMYVHLQKRIMYNKLQDLNQENYYIIPNIFIPDFDLSIKNILSVQPQWWHLYWDYIKYQCNSKMNILLNKQKVKMFYKSSFEKWVSILLCRKDK